MLIKDWEYLEDKLSMGHMALFNINNYTLQLCCGWVCRRRALKHKRER